MDDYTGCPFGWVIASEGDYPIAHHAGIILSWNRDQPWDSIVAHYGAWSQPSIFTDTLLNAAIYCQAKIVHINPHWRATFTQEPYTLTEDLIIVPSYEILSYAVTHPIYDICTCNCQHFVKHFIPEIAIESDLFPYLTTICTSILKVGIFSNEEGIKDHLDNLLTMYSRNRDTGICNWDYSLDMKVP